MDVPDSKRNNVPRNKRKSENSTRLPKTERKWGGGGWSRQANVPMTRQILPGYGHPMGLTGWLSAGQTQGFLFGVGDGIHLHAEHALDRGYFLVKETLRLFNGSCT